MGTLLRLPTVTYITLNNEVTIKDIAEGFQRALTTQGGLAPNEEFVAIVHSTGMQVVRSWVRADPRRVARLKHLIAFAPATFGSPIARQGRSWLGAIFKGNKHLGPDFLNAGDLVLSDLEPASTFTWDLAQNDILSGAARYDDGAKTPYVFVFCGTGNYSGLEGFANLPGTDGTVRRAGCGMNARKIDIDLTEEGVVALKHRARDAPDVPATDQERVLAYQWLDAKIPVHLIKGDDGTDAVNHASILSAPPAELQDLVVSALQVSDETTYSTWLQTANAPAKMAAMPEQFQQFIVRAVDERDDPITDYNVQLYAADEGGNEARLMQFTEEVDAYDGDKSYRSFHVDISRLLPPPPGVPPNIVIKVLANSGTTYVAYLGYGFEKQLDDTGTSDSSAWDAVLRFDGATVAGHQLFRPYTTTLIRLYLDRQVLPSDRTQPCQLVVWDVWPPEAPAAVA